MTVTASKQTGHFVRRKRIQKVIQSGRRDLLSTVPGFCVINIVNSDRW